MADPRLKERYKSEIAPEMMREFKYGNLMEVPRVDKITVNIGLGEAKENARAVDSATSDIATITGQKPVVTKSKKPSPASRSVKTRPSAAWSRCAACRCMNSWTVS